MDFNANFKMFQNLAIILRYSTLNHVLLQMFSKKNELLPIGHVDKFAMRVRSIYLRSIENVLVVLRKIYKFIKWFLLSIIFGWKNV